MTLPNELAWIPDLVRGVFFAPCERHSAGSKGEQVNLFSVSGRRAMCAACAAETSVKDAIQVRRARDETWIFYACAFVSFSPLVLLRVARQRGTNATQCGTPGLASRQLGGLNGWEGRPSRGETARYRSIRVFRWDDERMIMERTRVCLGGMKTRESNESNPNANRD